MALPLASTAQETTGTGETLPMPAAETGSLLRAQAALLLEGTTLPEKPEAFVQNVSSARTAWQQQKDRLTERWIEHRRDCRMQMRQANRDQIARVAADCYRADLLQELHLLTQRNDVLLSVLLASDADAAQSVRNAHEHLQDAMQAIIDGIDAGVFVSLQQLTTAKRNLAVQYRLPWLRSIAVLRAGQKRSLLLVQLQKLASIDENTVDAPLLHTSLQCALDAIGKVDAVMRSFAWDDARDKLTESIESDIDCNSAIKKTLDSAAKQAAEDL